MRSGQPVVVEQNLSHYFAVYWQALFESHQRVAGLAEIAGLAEDSYYIPPR